MTISPIRIKRAIDTLFGSTCVTPLTARDELRSKLGLEYDVALTVNASLKSEADFIKKYPKASPSVFQALQIYEQVFGNNDGQLNQKDFSFALVETQKALQSQVQKLHSTINQLTPDNAPQIREKALKIIHGALICFEPK